MTSAADWLASPEVTEQLAKSRAERYRLWLIVDRTFDDRKKCEAGCPWLDSNERGDRCDLRGSRTSAGGDVMDCAGVADALAEEREEA